MFNLYARVQPDSDDEESAGRLLEASAPPPPHVEPSILTSTSAIRGPSQQGVVLRGKGASGGFRPEKTLGAPYRPGAAPVDSGVTDLINLGDEVTSAPPKARASSRSRAGAQPQQVELVTLMPTDPFDFMMAQPAVQHQPPAPPGSQPRHPLDPAQGGGAAPVPTASASGKGFGLFGSFSDLLGASQPGGQAAGSTAAGRQGQQHGGAGTGPGPGPGAASGPSYGSFTGLASRGPATGGSLAMAHRHSHSTTGIDDLLQQQHADREAEALGWPVQPKQGLIQAPGQMRTDRGQVSSAADPFDPFSLGGVSSGPAALGIGSSTSRPGDAVAGDSGLQRNGVGGNGTAQQGSGEAEGAVGAADDGSGTGVGQPMSNRELHLWAIPLFKERLVFLPVVNWKDEPDTSTVLGKVASGVEGMQTSLSNMWHGLKDKGNFGQKIYKAGQAILENMNAEERLMRNIPRRANKLVVHHPATIPPDEIQDQLTQLTSSFCYKSAGKAAVAGVMLPVAVGLEVLAVPGIGWYTAYQLFKSTSAAAGGSRLNQYLKSDKGEVRVCYAGNPKLDIFVLKARLAPDDVLGSEDIEDLIHDIKEPLLAHPLQELRARFIKKNQTTKEDYALLPMSNADEDEVYGSGSKQGKKD